MKTATVVGKRFSYLKIESLRIKRLKAESLILMSLNIKTMQHQQDDGKWNRDRYEPLDDRSLAQGFDFAAKRVK